MGDTTPLDQDRSAADPSLAAAEHFDVLVVGAGLSGIGAGMYLEQEARWARYAVLEARHAIGGTWDLFRYPGIRSDSDMFTFGYRIRPWDRDDSIGAGEDIRRYIEESAEEFGVDRRIRFGHRILRADWSSEAARWTLTVQRDDAAGNDLGTVTLTCNFLFSCTGYYRYDHGHTPNFDGLDDFRGEVVHPQKWPADLDYEGKRVVVIGSGATAITLIPSLTDKAAKVTMLQRSPTYIVAAPRNSPVAALLDRILPRRRARAGARWFHAVTGQAFFDWCRRYPAAGRRLLENSMRRLLPDDYDFERDFSPRYDPWQQRVCLDPDGTFFAAINEGRAEVATDTIERFTPTGIRLESGQELDADIVVTATGLEMLFLGGIQLTVDGNAIDPADHFLYRGMMLDGVPNLAVAVGYINGSWTLKAELVCRYVPQLINEMKAQGQRQVTAIKGSDDMAPLPLMDLNAGYVARAADQMPKQADRDLWRNHQRYLTDYRLMKRTPVVSEGLKLSNPGPWSDESGQGSPTDHVGAGRLLTHGAHR